MGCQRIRDGYICEISYVKKAIDAQKRLVRGERQTLCPICNKWRWPKEDTCIADREPR